MLGHNINKIRKHRKLTLNSCAKFADLDPSCLNDLEAGIIKNPTRYVLENIAYALAVETSCLSKVNLDIEKIDDFFNIPKEYLDSYKVPIREKREFIEYLATFCDEYQVNNPLNNIEPTTKTSQDFVNLAKEYFWESKALNKRK